MREFEPPDKKRTDAKIHIKSDGRSISPSLRVGNVSPTTSMELLCLGTTSQLPLGYSLPVKRGIFFIKKSHNQRYWRKDVKFPSQALTTSQWSLFIFYRLHLLFKSRSRVKKVKAAQQRYGITESVKESRLEARV